MGRPSQPTVVTVSALTGQIASTVARGKCVGPADSLSPHYTTGVNTITTDNFITVGGDDRVRGYGAV